ncbi:hypothetical protein SAMN04489740_1192 [Arthrobacter alpinus]|uniref:Uncharacterized protein n=1 Tax=Arthrobacter alpinus TaxID=656366 RepID=A0A1H5I3M4_9MICC|nr:hypothetical protein SAMN04489740_1192 [Arthrobacter alpinus]
MGNRPTASIDAAYAEMASDAVHLAFTNYGKYSIPLAATRDNYLIVVDNALYAAATTLEHEAIHFLTVHYFLYTAFCVALRHGNCNAFGGSG